MDVSNECITGNDEEDFSSIKLSARSIVAAHQSDEINTPMMTQVLMNPTNERRWVPEGTILGWVEEAPDILSIQEVLRQQMTKPTREMGEEQVEEIQAVLEEADKTRKEAIAHEPAFNLPDHHPMHGKSGNEMDRWVLQYEASEMRAW